MLQLGIVASNPKLDIGRLSRDPATTIATLDTGHYTDIPWDERQSSISARARKSLSVRPSPGCPIPTLFPRVPRPRAFCLLACLLTRRAKRPHDATQVSGKRAPHVSPFLCPSPQISSASDCVAGLIKPSPSVLVRAGSPGARGGGQSSLALCLCLCTGSGLVVLVVRRSAHRLSPDGAGGVPIGG